ncbi:MAG: TonB family protein [Acidobacteriaceae bacterium]|nr:TonB family protein [Acidobacteriaceae bacterium]MBV9779877.1 TonB family protein [Acidobacteriaceae bacterium]
MPRLRQQFWRDAFVILTLGAVSVGPGLAQKPQSMADYFVGHAAPDFHLKDLGGHDVELRSLKGQVVVLDFWAAWCGPCRAEIPAIERLSKQFAKKNVVVLGVNSEEPEDTVRRFVAKNKLTYRIVLTRENAAVIRQYGARNLPTIAVIDKDGIIAAYRVGERPDSEDLIYSDIHHVLSAKYVAPQPKPIQLAQTPATTPVPPTASAPSGPDPNWKPQTAEEFLARGFVRLNLHQNSAAKTDAEEALKLYPDSSIALFLHGRTAYEEKDYSTAIEDFNKVIQARPNWPRGYLFRGLSYSYSGHHDLAVPDYQKAIQLNPYVAAGYNDLGWAYRELNQFDKATTNLSKAIELEPDFVRARENRAILFGTQKRWPDELAELNLILRISPNDQWARQAVAAAQQGQLPAAIPTPKQPNQPRADVEPVIVSKTEAEYTDEARHAGVSAIVVCSAVIDTAGVPQNIKVERGAGFGLDEMAIRAIASWRFKPATINGEPVAVTANIEVNFRLLVAPHHDNQIASLQLNLPSGAIRPELTHGKIPENPKDDPANSDLKVALTVDSQGKPQDVSLLNTTSTAWAEKTIEEIKHWRFRPAELNGQPIEVKGTFEVGTRFGAPQSPASTAGAPQAQEPDPTWQPKTPDEFLARGYMRLHAHKYAQAEADADDALKLQPDAVMALFLRGRAAYDNKEYQVALDAFDKVVHQAPDWAEAHRRRGLAKSRLGQHQLALEDYQKAIQLEPEFASAYNDLGWAYLDLGQLDSARANLDKAIELEPNLIVARENRAKLCAKQADLQAEQKELTIILGLSPQNAWAKDTLEAVRQKLQ